MKTESEVGDEGGMVIGEALKINTSLQELFLGGGVNTRRTKKKKKRNNNGVNEQETK